ncbi:EF-hand domain-containing protein, partial [Enterobacter quasihormaechei]|uniref:EF-hand domain-containing protein n=1 Tax=Enterobacter quasihormaechei TaxID=2529382 RepID=UPI003A0FE4BD
MYSSSYTAKYQKLLKQMDSNQDGVIDAGELWRFLHNRQPHIRYQVQRLVVKHHSEWLKDGT